MRTGRMGGTGSWSGGRDLGFGGEAGVWEPRKERNIRNLLPLLPFFPPFPCFSSTVRSPARRPLVRRPGLGIWGQPGFGNHGSAEHAEPYSSPSVSSGFSVVFLHSPITRQGTRCSVTLLPPPSPCWPGPGGQGGEGRRGDRRGCGHCCPLGRARPLRCTLLGRQGHRVVLQGRPGWGGACGWFGG